MTARTHRDFPGSVVGLLVFLGGVVLLFLVFRLAYEQFSTPPQQALSLHPGKAIDFVTTGGSLVGIFLKIILMLVMGLMASVIANRGVTLYSHCKATHVAGDAKSKDIEEEEQA